MVVVDEEYALSVIRKSKNFQKFEEGKKVKSVSIRVLSDDQGYVAVVHHAIVHFECGTDFSFIIKAPSLERCVDTFALDNDDPNSLTLVHNRECEVYEFLDKCNVLAPKLYDMRLATDLVKDPGYILMESFVGRGVVLGLRHQVSSKQVINVAHHLGKMRAEVGKIKDVKPWNDPFRVEGTLVDELFDKESTFMGAPTF
ncbi:unnamed protein product [Bursaphelenchus xylophilus]|uniref:(pine wood nematode) hypothetical protein n=1 Tax=Bursaphelenchus xylophilus TaxID=6326 RepID=A0A1I7S4V5_BURXY|nr:unnamed protein product [Bursaphelenchus xylophilus]CAG9117403.1 unnamed protein product [Bursaphelenchus xylophilus]